MNKIGLKMTAVAAAALVTMSAATPAQAQYRDYDRRDRGGINVGEVIAGIAVVGGIAAAASAIAGGDRYNRGYNNGYGTYGYGYDNAYGYGEGAAINACQYQAARYGRASITDVDRRNNRTYRVRGVIDAGYNNGYGNGGYNDGYYNRGYNRGGYGGYERRTFTCNVRDDGRVTKFNTGRARY